MNICLFGYGKMGKAVEKIAVERGHTISMIIDVGEQYKLKQEAFLKSDLVIEFTSPESGPTNCELILNSGKTLISGTTGWKPDIAKIENICKEEKNAFFHAPNFSIGVNIFFEINRRLGELLNSFHDYDAVIEESHHIHKLDKPSGTAVRLADDILEVNKKYEKWSLENHDRDNSIQIKSFREGEIIGTHYVKWENDIDEIIIKHSAKDRTGFALGAVLAAEFAKNKTGILTMKDLLNI